MDGLCHIVTGIYVHIHINFNTHFADPVVLRCLVNMCFRSSYLLMCVFLLGTNKLRTIFMVKNKCIRKVC